MIYIKHPEVISAIIAEFPWARAKWNLKAKLIDELKKCAKT